MALNWANYLSIVIDSSKISDNLINFPLPIRLSASCGTSSYDASDVFTKISYANRKKIAVTLSDKTTQCCVEIERWDTSNNIAALHVKIPSISSSVDTTLYFWYDPLQSDNSTYVGDTGDTPAQNVWDSYFAAVFHLHQSSPQTIGNIVDSKSGIASTQTTVDSGDGEKEGQFGYACDFNGDYLNFGSPSILEITGDITLEVLCKSDVSSPSTNNGIFCKHTAAGRGYGLYHHTNNRMGFILSLDGGDVNITRLENGSTALGTDWHYLAGVYDQSETHAETQVDDAIEESTDYAIASINSSSSIYFYIGLIYSGSYDYNGLIDEVRVSITPRSSAWRDATSYGLADTLSEIGAVQLTNNVAIGLNVTLANIDPESPGAKRTLYLIHMAEDNGSRTITEDEYFPSEYKDNRPIARIHASWIVGKAIQDRTGYHIKEYHYDTTAESDYEYGEDLEENDPFSIYGPNYAATDYVTPAQEEKLTYHHMQNCRLRLPMMGDLPVPAEKITFENENLEQGITGYMHTRSIMFDYNNDEFIIEGEGVFTEVS